MYKFVLLILIISSLLALSALISILVYGFSDLLLNVCCLASVVASVFYGILSYIKALNNHPRPPQRRTRKSK